MRNFKLLSLFATTCLTAYGAITQSGSDATSIYAIRDVTIVNVEKETTLPGQTVVVVNERIEKIGSQKTIDIPENAVIVDGHGLDLMPGLVDAHVHYLDAPVFGLDMIKVYSKLDKDVFLAIVDEEQKSGLKVVGYVPEEIYMEEAVAARLQDVQHLHGFQKIIAKLLGEPVELGFIGMASDADYFSRFSDLNQQDLQSVYKQLRVSGLTACPTIVVFKSATEISAIKAGSYPQSEYISPMVLVRGNPLEDIRNTQKIESVFLRGEYFSHQKLDQLMNEARDLAPSSNP